MKTNITAACECWTNQTIVIGRIKEFKCQQKDNQKLVTKFKVIKVTIFLANHELLAS